MMSKKKFSEVLRKYSKLNAEAHILRSEIAEHCMEVYGCDPADVDFDGFIDACELSGAGGTITAEEFDSGMRECMEMAGKNHRGIFR